MVHGYRIVQHITHTEHAAGMPACAQIRQGRIELPDRTPRHRVHDQHVRLERLERGTDHLRSQGDQLLQGDVEKTRVVLPVLILAERWEG